MVFHQVGEVSPVGSVVCSDVLNCVKCSNPASVSLCSHFNLKNSASECKDCERPIDVVIPEGSVSPFGIVVGNGGVSCVFCEKNKEATCEDFGENSSAECPDGYVSERTQHYVNYSWNGFFSNCKKKISCFKCNPPYSYP